MLMYVLHSEGSSPGRQGFKMLVSGSGLISGSIGGGIMEYKLVELCRQELANKAVKQPFSKRQIHQSNIARDKSGMICSGEQTIAFYPLGKSDLTTVSGIIEADSNGQYGVFIADEQGIRFDAGASLSEPFETDISNPEKWLVKEDFGHFPELHIVGGGHVSLALSKLANQVGFVVKIYDDRTDLNTVAQNQYAECILVSDYENIGNYLLPGSNKYVALMSFGYRTDKIVLQQLLDLDFKYLGMMGSAEKVKTLFAEMLAEGTPQAQLDKVHSPIGLPIASKTPEEIAVSILAEVIRVKNIG